MCSSFRAGNYPHLLLQISWHTIAQAADFPAEFFNTCHLSRAITTPFLRTQSDYFLLFAFPETHRLNIFCNTWHINPFSKFCLFCTSSWWSQGAGSDFLQWFLQILQCWVSSQSFFVILVYNSLISALTFCNFFFCECWNTSSQVTVWGIVGESMVAERLSVRGQKSKISYFCHIPFHIFPISRSYL